VIRSCRDDITLRPSRDDDAPGIIALVAACWAEYPGCVMDLDGENPELRRFASYCAAGGGAAWVAEESGEIAGMIAAVPLGPGEWEVKRLYVDGASRGTGLARRLLALAESHARDGGAQRLVLWTDTRFDRAHRFYERESYIRAGPIRALGDRSNSLEFRYAKPLGPVAVERLDAAGAASAERRLAAILVACVDAGAAVTFLPPLDLGVARAYWRSVSTEAATGKVVLLTAWSDGEMVGTVQVGLDTPPNQPHRAEVRKLLVHPGARRRGVGQALMRCAEEEAARAGRRLITLDTRAGDAAEVLYRASGWHEAGRFPGYALNGDGSEHDAVLFWKRVGPS
jgi:ribosomal protein S18 acetylase RimI-like enzyme